jgi:hypothetical protein
MARRIRTSALTALLAITTPLLALALLELPLRANTKELPYPTLDELRQIQLAALDCGRENQASFCDKTRQMADPLMDHPKLAASCKDAVWSILQRAKVASQNSYERREQLNKASSDLLVFCKQQTGSVLGNTDDLKGEKKSRFGLIPNQSQ